MGKYFYKKKIYILSFKLHFIRPHSTLHYQSIFVPGASIRIRSPEPLLYYTLYHTNNDEQGTHRRWNYWITYNNLVSRLNTQSKGHKRIPIRRPIKHITWHFHSNNENSSRGKYNHISLKHWPPHNDKCTHTYDANKLSSQTIKLNVYILLQPREVLMLCTVQNVQ